MSHEQQDQPPGEGGRPAAASAKASLIARSLRATIEFVGTHPFATGLMAILGIVGFVLSVISFSMDIENAAQSQADTDALKKDLGAVVAQTMANCRQAPCWTLAEFVRSDPVRKPKELIENKLPAALEKNGGEYVYEIDGCRVRIEYTNDAVTYFMVSLYKPSTNAESGASAAQALCPFDIGDVYHPESPPIAGNDAVVDVEAVLRSTIVPAVGGSDAYIPEIYIAQACIDCGNAAEPFIELVKPGTHSENFRSFHFRTEFAAVSGDDDADFNMLSGFGQAMKNRIGPDAAYGIELAALCDKDVFREALTILGRARVSEVGVSIAPRVQPNALHCS